MMYLIGLYTKSSEFRRISSAVALPIVAVVWILFLLIRYPKFDGLIKAGVCTMMIGVFSFFADNLINNWLGTNLPLPAFRPFVWNLSTVDGNVKWLLLLGCTVAGIILIILGIIKECKKGTAA